MPKRAFVLLFTMNMDLPGAVSLTNFWKTGTISMALVRGSRGVQPTLEGSSLGVCARSSYNPRLLG